MDEPHTVSLLARESGKNRQVKLENIFIQLEEHITASLNVQNPVQRSILLGDPSPPCLQVSSGLSAVPVASLLPPSEESDIFEDTICSRGSGSLKRGNTTSSDSTTGNEKNEEKRPIGDFKLADIKMKNRNDLKYKKIKQNPRAEFAVGSNKIDDRKGIRFLDDKSLSESDFDSSSDDDASSTESTNGELQEKHESNVINFSKNTNYNYSDYSEPNGDSSNEHFNRGVRHEGEQETRNLSPVRDPLKIFDGLMQLQSEKMDESDLSDPRSRDGGSEEEFPIDEAVLSDNSTSSVDDIKIGKDCSEIIPPKGNEDKQVFNIISEDLEEVDEPLNDEVKACKHINLEQSPTDSTRVQEELEKHERDRDFSHEENHVMCDLAQENSTYTKNNTDKESSNENYEMSSTSDNAQIDSSDNDLPECNTNEKTSRLNSYSADMKRKGGANGHKYPEEVDATYIPEFELNEEKSVTDNSVSGVSTSDEEPNKISLKESEAQIINVEDVSRKSFSLDSEIHSNILNDPQIFEPLQNNEDDVFQEECADIDNTSEERVCQPNSPYCIGSKMSEGLEKPITGKIGLLGNVKEDFVSCVSLDKYEDQLSSESDFDVFESSLSLTNDRVTEMMTRVKRQLSSEIMENQKIPETISSYLDHSLDVGIAEKITYKQTFHDLSPHGDNEDTVNDKHLVHAKSSKDPEENSILKSKPNFSEMPQYEELIVPYEASLEKANLTGNNARIILNDCSIPELSSGKNPVDILTQEDNTKETLLCDDENVASNKYLFQEDPSENVSISSLSDVLVSSYIDTEALRELRNKLSSEGSQTKISTKEGSVKSESNDVSCGVTLSDIDLGITRKCSSFSLGENTDFDTDILENLKKDVFSGETSGSEVGSEGFYQNELGHDASRENLSEGYDNESVTHRNREASAEEEVFFGEEEERRKVLAERLRSLQETLGSLHSQLTEEREWNKVIAAELAMETKRLEESRQYGMMMDQMGNSGFGCRSSVLGWGQVEMVREQIRAKRMVAAMEFKARLVEVEAKCTAELDNLENVMEKLEPLNRMASVWAPVPDYTCAELSSSWMRRDFFMEVTRSMNLSSNERDHQPSLQANETANKVA